MSDFNPMFAREAALKAFLKKEGVAFDDKEELKVLRHMGVARVKRNARVKRGGGSFAFGVAAALNISAVKEILVEMRAENIEKKTVKAIFVIDDVSDDVTITRHNANGESGCYGVMKQGVCSKCQWMGGGVECFKFEMVLEDLYDTDVKLEISAAKGVGEAVFRDKTPAEVKAMPRKEIDDVWESWMTYPVMASLMLKYDAERDETKVYPYRMVKLSMEHMPESRK